MNRSARFWDQLAERYSRQPIADEAAYEKKLQVTRDYFRADMNVLEFGCGTGATAIAHAPFVKHIHAIDISSKMIGIARRRIDPEQIDNVTFEQAAIDDYQASDNTLDAVLGLSILHLVENREAVIAMVHRMLRPGGVFVSSTVCLGDSMKYMKWIAPIGRFLGVLPILEVFTSTELEGELTAAGFQVDYRWQPGKGKAVFIVAVKPDWF